MLYLFLLLDLGTMVLVYLLLVTFGIVNVYSATFSETLNGLFDISQPVGKQVFFLFSSLFTGIIILIINSKFFEQFATLGYIIGILLLIGLFPFGKTVSGATSWYNIAGLSLQPSELAKVTTALMIAGLLSKFQTDLKSPTTLLKIGGYLLLPFLLIVLQPDPGSALVFGAFFFPLFREGLNYAFMVIFISVLVLFLITLTLPIGAVIAIISLLIFLLFNFYIYLVVSKR